MSTANEDMHAKDHGSWCTMICPDGCGSEQHGWTLDGSCKDLVALCPDSCGQFLCDGKVKLL